MEQDSLLTPVEIRAEVESFSPARPLKKVIFLSILTFGFYNYYWFYRNWKDFQGRGWPADNWPLLRTIGLWIPIVCPFVAYNHFKVIGAELNENASRLLQASPLFLTILWLMQNPLKSLATKHFPWAMPFSLVPMIILVTALLCYYQRALNAHWADEMPGEPVRERFSTGEKVTLTLGSFLWLYQLMGFLLPE